MYIKTVLLFVFGTRPEAIKIGPVVAALRHHGTIPSLLLTGQHTSLLAGTPAETDVADAVSLKLGSLGDVTDWFRTAQPTITSAIRDRAPSVVIVQGDTMSAVAGARSAHALRIPVAHIEAGVRSGTESDPWPEEGFRKEITQLATWHYASTSQCVAHLLAEGVPSQRIRCTGNSVVSALARYATAPSGPLRDNIFVTFHRRELTSARIRFRKMVEAMNTWAKTHPRMGLIWPVHPSVPILRPSRSVVSFTLCPPLPYPQCIQTIRECRGVVTDSGGLVEECATLGVPCAQVRYVSDRPESLAAGLSRRFDPVARGVLEALNWIWRDRPYISPSPIYGTPDAAQQIAHHLTKLD